MPGHLSVANPHRHRTSGRAKHTAIASASPQKPLSASYSLAEQIPAATHVVCANHVTMWHRCAPVDPSV